MKGYKAFNSNLTCRGMQYEVGKTYKMSESPICCERGYHFCKNIADVYKYYDMSEDTRICEVVALGEIVTDDDKKYCTNKIKIVKEIKNKAIKHCNIDKTDVGYCNSGYYNSGNSNSGNYNSGDKNSGDYNSGHYNSGNSNSGDYNIGYYNSGNNNRGDYNSGNWNSGDYNSGYWNSGSCNSGNWNSGNWNSGSCNSGNWNSGNWNSGYWNSGNYNSGVFNTSKKTTIKMFDKESSWTINDWLSSNAYQVLITCPYTYSDFVREYNMTDEEKAKHPEYKTIGGYVKTFVATKEDKQKWWDNLLDSDKQECFNLPNFDANKFVECLGIEHI